MRDSLVILILCVVALGLGAFMFIYAPGHVQPVAYVPPQNGTTSGNIPQAPVQQAASVEVAFSDIASGTQAKVTEPTNYVVYAADAFLDLWNKIGKPPPPPKVDFTKHDVIAAFAGQQPTGGYSIRIEKIVDEAGKRIVSILLTKPGKNCVTTDSVTEPFDVVTAPASAATPIRQMETKTVDCP